MSIDAKEIEDILIEIISLKSFVNGAKTITENIYFDNTLNYIYTKLADIIDEIEEEIFMNKYDKEKSSNA